MYKDNDISMVVILPKKKDGLPEVEKKLSAKALSQALALLRAATLHVSLPKFKITEQFSLGGELAKLGMQDAFLPKIADFTGMETKLRRKEDSLYIYEVLHKAFVEVDEKGTEAAAATAVAADRPNSPDAIPTPPIRFRADHPFLFLLRHNATGSILFMGRVYDPRGN
jgi:serpin B